MKTVIVWKSPDEPPKHDDRILVHLRRSGRVTDASYCGDHGRGVWYEWVDESIIWFPNIIEWAEWPEPAAERVEVRKKEFCYKTRGRLPCTKPSERLCDKCE